MPRVSWSRLIAVLCGVGSTIPGTSISAFQFSPGSSDSRPGQYHAADSWVGGGFQSRGSIHQAPADFGPISGMQNRTSDGNPASGDSFQVMQPGSLPGGFDPRGFNSSGMIPPVNQPGSIANDPYFGGRPQNSSSAQGGPSPYGFDPSGSNGQFRRGPNGEFLSNAPAWQSLPNHVSPQMVPGYRPQPKVSWGMAAAKTPYVGLLGQVAKPGVYEVEQATTLSDLLERVGGLAKDATGQFRVIRNGHMGLSTSFAGAARFELMAGDLVVADAQPTSLAGYSSSSQPQYGQSSARDDQSKAAAGVQVGFIHLTDRPVVLKIRTEHANVYSILSLMRQDESLASRIKIVTPSGQRSSGPTRPDITLPSDTVLIFPENTVRTDRLATLPEPTKLNRNAEPPAKVDAPDASPVEKASPAPAPIAPEVSSAIEQPQQVTEVPPPPTERPFSNSSSGGIRRSPPRPQDRIARDSHMVLAPPAENPNDISDADVATSNISQDSTTAPAPTTSVWSNEDEPTGRPSLLKPGQRKPIALANDSSIADNTSSSDDDKRSSETSTVTPAIRWSIWPPILTAVAGLLALFGFSWSLRRRTQTTAQSPLPQTPLARSQPTHRSTEQRAPRSTTSSGVGRSAEPTKPVTTQPATQSVARSNVLESLINNQLPLVEEQVPLASPMQFHGRPQPQKTFRIDQEHSLPRPHVVASLTPANPPEQIVAGTSSSASRAEEPNRGSSPQVSSLPPSVSVARKTRIDRNMMPDLKTLSAANSPSASASASSTLHSQPPISALDRALSAVRQRGGRNA